ncbi:MAG: hypothetical protein FWE67_14470 [Planctomycetaceae bacterium]|nr:hypothetical protein [Planctomycetaceae bacterium]
MTDNTPPKPFWKKRLFYVLLMPCLVFFLWAFYIFFIWEPPIIISAATTRITGPLTANGDIDFFKALEQRFSPLELATDDNGYRDFVRLFGDVRDRVLPDPEFYRLQTYEKLGLDPNIPPTLTLPSNPPIPYDFAIRPWTLRDYPMLEEWVKDVDIPLDALADAIRKPVFFAPYLQSSASVESGKPHNLITLIPPDALLFREIARMFQARATYRIAQGNIDGAIDDKLTLMRFGRLIPHGGFLIQYFVGFFIEGAGADIPIGANPKHPLTEQQIRRLLEGLDALPPRASINDAFEVERHMGLSCIQEIAKRRNTLTKIFGPAGVGRMDFVMSFSCDWNVVFWKMNQAYDAVQEPSPRTRYNSMVSPPTGKITAGKVLRMVNLLNPNGRGNLVGDMFIALFGPGVVSTEEAVRQAECRDNLQRLSLAVLLYQCETGKLPDENWAAQIEKYLGENPKQYFSCPSNPSPEGETTYAMVQYADAVGGSLNVSLNSRDVLLFVELATPVPLAKAVISVDDVLNRRNIGSEHDFRRGMNVARSSAAVESLSEKVSSEDLKRLVGE